MALVSQSRLKNLSKFSSLPVYEGAMEALKGKIEAILTGFNNISSKMEAVLKIPGAPDISSVRPYLEEVIKYFTDKKEELFNKPGHPLPSQDVLDHFLQSTLKLQEKLPKLPNPNKFMSLSFRPLRALIHGIKLLVKKFPTHYAAIGQLYVVLKINKNTNNEAVKPEAKKQVNEGQDVVLKTQNRLANKVIDLVEANKILEEGQVIFCSGSMPDKSIAQDNVLIVLRIPADFAQKSYFSIGNIERILWITSEEYLEPSIISDRGLPVFDIKSFPALQLPKSEKRLVDQKDETGSSDTDNTSLQVTSATKNEQSLDQNTLQQLEHYCFSEAPHIENAVFPPSEDGRSLVGVKLSNLLIYYWPGGKASAAWGIAFIDYDRKKFITVSTGVLGRHFASFEDMFPISLATYYIDATSGSRNYSPEQLVHIHKIRELIIKAGLIPRSVTLQELEDALNGDPEHGKKTAAIKATLTDADLPNIPIPLLTEEKTIRTTDSALPDIIKKTLSIVVKSFDQILLELTEKVRADSAHKEIEQKANILIDKLKQQRSFFDNPSLEAFSEFKSQCEQAFSIFEKQPTNPLDSDLFGYTQRIRGLIQILLAAFFLPSVQNGSAFFMPKPAPADPGLSCSMPADQAKNKVVETIGKPAAP